MNVSVSKIISKLPKLITNTWQRAVSVAGNWRFETQRVRSPSNLREHIIKQQITKWNNKQILISALSIYVNTYIRIYVCLYVIEIVIFKYLFSPRFPTLSFRRGAVWRGRKSGSLGIQHMTLTTYTLMSTYVQLALQDVFLAKITKRLKLRWILAERLEQWL